MLLLPELDFVSQRKQDFGGGRDVWFDDAIRFETQMEKGTYLLFTDSFFHFHFWLILSVFDRRSCFLLLHFDFFQDGG